MVSFCIRGVPPRSRQLSARRNTVRQWLIFAAIVAVVELAASLVSPAGSPLERGERFYPPTRVPTSEESTIQWQLDRLLRESAQLVIIGDSSAMMGLEPAAFEHHLGLTTQNFGTVSWLHTEGHADILDLYIDTHGPPRAVLYQMGTLIHLIPHDELVGTGLLDSFRSWLGADEASYPVPLPSLSWRDPVRAFVEGGHYPEQYLNAIRGQEPPDHVVREQLELTNGMNVDHAVRSDWDDVAAPDVVYQASIESGLRRVFEAAERHGFEVFVVHNPIPVRFRSDDLDAAYGTVEEALRDLAEGYPRTHVLGPFARYLPTELFANFEHLTPVGARANSTELAAPIGWFLSNAEAAE